MSHQDKLNEFGADDDFIECPMKGLWAPMLAAEGLAHVFQKLADLGEKELVAETQLFLPAESWETIVSDYHKSIATFETIIRVKTAPGPYYSLTWRFFSSGWLCQCSESALSRAA